MGLASLFGAVPNPLFAQSGSREIAFLSDIHLQDVYADLQSVEFKGTFNPITQKFATIRTMKSQINSTRLFNENYFAFISALEDLKKKGIQIVVLPGDFTDDGQPMNVLALRKILDQYTQEAGMRFFLTTGNHDPVKPFGGTAGKSDFLGTDGSEQAIAGSQDYFSTSAAVTDQINYWGYADITNALADHGFFPSKQDLFWSHPFEKLDYENYNFEKASASANLENRIYQEKNSGLYLPDASYVVEPIEGIWLLAIDGNVYQHSEEGSKENWNGSSIGFNLASVQKNHQLEWIKKVKAEADKRGKTLISFSHYPLVDFHDGASEDMKMLFGKEKFQLARVPSQNTSSLYAEAGIQIHFAGHMHFNDTGIYHQPSTHQTMYNIQVPSLAAFPPAYKTLKETAQNELEIETIALTEVDRMNEFFDLYRMEHRWLLENQKPGIWDTTILASKDYLEYTRNHLMELTRSRFIPSDWPKDLASILVSLDQKELTDWSEMEEKQATDFLQSKLTNEVSTSSHSSQIIDDFYLLKNGDELGKRLIPKDRIDFYEEFLANMSTKTYQNESTLHAKLIQYFGIFNKLYYSLPSDHFRIDLKKNTIEKID